MQQRPVGHGRQHVEEHEGQEADDDAGVQVRFQRSARCGRQAETDGGDQPAEDRATPGQQGGEVPVRPDYGISEIDAVHHTLVDAAHRLNELLSRERPFSADLAHQLRTPLASLRLRLETEQGQHDHDHELVEDALRDLDRLESTIDDLVALARDITPGAPPRPLATVLKDSVAPWYEPVAAQHRQLEVTLESELPYVTARAQAVRQILDVLLANAAHHGSGTITVTGNRVGRGTVVAVTDEGSGTVDPALIFQRRHPDSMGTGIGIALARRLAETEDLRLVLADPGPGPTFHLVFGGPRIASGDR